jgi:hypothetical protein
MMHAGVFCTEWAQPPVSHGLPSRQLSQLYKFLWIIVFDLLFTVLTVTFQEGHVAGFVPSDYGTHVKSQSPPYVFSLF